MEDNVLKKEFSSRDVNRARNLITKKFAAKTVVGTGYQKAQIVRKEGDIWEENGKSWTIKNGIKQNVTKLDAAKKAIRIPLTCPKCSGSMRYYLSQKMYKIHGMCFDCVITYEADLRKAGLYDQYEKAMMQGSMRAFAKDLEQWVFERINTVNSFITEQGDVEDWNSNANIVNANLSGNLQEYLKHLREYIDS